MAFTDSGSPHFVRWFLRDGLSGPQRRNHQERALKTSFTTLIGIELPLQNSPMGGVATPLLAAAVARAGGLGMIPGQMIPPAVLAGILDQQPRDLPGAFGVGFLVPFTDKAAVEVAASRVRVIDFFFGDPDRELVAIAHRGGALASWQVGSVAEAKAAEVAGVDFVVVQGSEAGGRQRATGSLLGLIRQVVREVSLPVVAAGGIGTRDDAARALEAGASGFRIGTRFVAAEESGAHSVFVDQLIASTSADTVVTSRFAANWPASPESRVLRRSLEAAESFVGEIVAHVTVPGGQVIPVPRFGLVPPLKNATGFLHGMPMYAGTGVDSVTRVQPAADIIAELTADLDSTLETMRLVTAVGG